MIWNIETFLQVHVLMLQPQFFPVNMVHNHASTILNTRKEDLETEFPAVLTLYNPSI